MFDSLFPKYWTTLQRLMWLKTNALARAVYETITGNPVTFVAISAPLRKLQIAFSPAQDLNGYDSPWPAGGGKNKLQNKGESGSSNGITWTMNADGSVTLGGTASDVVTIGFNTSSAKQTIANGSCDVVCSANASYNPNINGLNFQNDIYADGTYVGTIQKDNNRRSVTGDVIQVGTSRLRIAADTVIPNNTTFYPAIEIGSTISASWSPFSNICPISGWSSLTVYHSGADTSNPQTISITLGSTVYSGWVDAVTGIGEIDWVKMTVERGVTIGLNEQDNNTTRIGVLLPNARRVSAAERNQFICNMGAYSAGATGENAQIGDCTLYTVTAGVYFLFHTPKFSTYDEAFTYLVENECSVVYELATPIPIQLTPQEINSLAGDNVMWTDADSLTVEYRSN